MPYVSNNLVSKSIFKFMPIKLYCRSMYREVIINPLKSVLFLFLHRGDRNIRKYQKTAAMLNAKITNRICLKFSQKASE